VMGVLQAAFGASQILGLPAGLFFSNHWGWHAPFFMIVVIGLFAGLFIVMKLQPIDEHLKLKNDRNPFQHLWHTLYTGRYLLAFGATALLSVGGYMMMPFGSTFMVGNLGLKMEQLPIIYLVTGICAFVLGPVIGKAADRFGKYRTFVVGAILTMILVSVYTRLGPVGLIGVMLINVVMYVAIFSRVIPAQALNSAIPEPANRGSFMAVSASMQQMAGGIGSLVAGYIVRQNEQGALEHFDSLGNVMVLTTLITIGMMYFVNRMVEAKMRAGKPA
jgi:predicted MFS family arabinose efflux permease